MTFRVTAPLVLALDQGGRTHHCYEGAVIEWLSPEQKAHFLGAGLVVDLGASDAPHHPEDDGEPHAAATKAELIAWLVENAVKPDGGDYTAGALQPLNKDELRALIEAVD